MTDGIAELHEMEKTFRFEIFKKCSHQFLFQGSLYVNEE